MFSLVAPEVAAGLAEAGTGALSPLLVRTGVLTEPLEALPSEDSTALRRGGIGGL